MKNIEKRIFLLLAVVILSLSLFAACDTYIPRGEETTISPSDCLSHTDVDDNGFCDSCNTDVIIEIDLYAINDLHGKLLDSDRQPGVDELTTYLKNAMKDNENTVIFSSGDMWQGSAESGLTYGNIMTDWMNELDFAFMTVGNHEFDWGGEYIAQNSSMSEFPFLAINIYESDSNERADFCEPSVTVDLGEIQIGFIGAIGDCYSSISAEMSEGYYFKTGYGLTELVKAESEKLRSEGVDLIVYSIHDSTDGCDLRLTSGGYVDIVFEGHSHSSYANLDRNGVYHIQGGGDNSGMSHAEISFNIANSKKEVSAEVIGNGEYSKSEPDSIVDTLMDKYDDANTLLTTPIGKNDKYRNSSELRSLVAERYAALAFERWEDYDVVLGGGYISCRSPGMLGAGEVSYAELYMLFPFNNKLALCSCSGTDLLNNYINSKNKNYFISYTDYGMSVIDNIDPNGVYYVVTDSFNYTYAPNNLTVVEIYDEVTYARDLVSDYIKEGGMSIAKPEAGEMTSIPELISIGESLAPGEESDRAYNVMGEIIEISNATYGNLYIEDQDGNVLFIYGVNQNGVRYDGIADKPQVGDTVVLCGSMKHYIDSTGGSVYELISAELVAIRE